jgi:hypothetical protein
MKGCLKIAVLTIVCFTAGCSLFPSGNLPGQNEAQAFTANTATTTNCEALGNLTAGADCDCYDKMSYDKVRGQATEKLHQEAQRNYPDSNMIQVSSVTLYLNRAVVSGTAYKCPSVSSR